jgi:hypothetical protein
MNREGWGFFWWLASILLAAWMMGMVAGVKWGIALPVFCYALKNSVMFGYMEGRARMENPEDPHA